MKTIPTALATHIANESTTLATCWKITRQDLTIMGFTDNDKDIAIGGINYIAASGFTPSALAESSALNIDNLEIDGILDTENITNDDILAGVYDGASVSIFLVNYLSPDDGIICLKEGVIGEITLKDNKFIAELRGITQKLSTKIGEIYAPTCRADFTDERCKLSSANFEFTGSLTAVNSRINIEDSSRTENAGIFSFGNITFTSGANIGISMEIKEFATNGKITLSLPLPYDANIGDNYNITEGCDKDFSTCSTRFNNALNFRGEPHLIGIDKLMQTSTTKR